MFTIEEFNVMVNELLCREYASYDMMCFIADKTLRPSVIRWCNAEPSLRGRGLEDDIMQEIQVRLIKTCVPQFLLRDGVDGRINNDPEGFRKWLFTLAVNIKKDNANRIRRGDYYTKELDENLVGSEDAVDVTGEKIEQLKRAFSVVIAADSQVYIVLTWIAYFVYTLSRDITKIQSNEVIRHFFEQKTLFEMHRMIVLASREIPWLQISEEQNRHILNALQKPWDDDRVYGEVKYREFYMKKGGKATISDWLNRMNHLVRRGMDDEAFDS